MFDLVLKYLISDVLSEGEMKFHVYVQVKDILNCQNKSEITHLYKRFFDKHCGIQQLSTLFTTTTHSQITNVKM